MSEIELKFVIDEPMAGRVWARAKELKLVSGAMGIIYLGAHGSLRRPPSAAVSKDKKRRKQDDETFSQGLDLYYEIIRDYNTHLSEISDLAQKIKELEKKIKPYDQFYQNIKDNHFYKKSFTQ